MGDVSQVAISSTQADAEMTSLQQVLSMSEFAVNQLVETITQSATIMEQVDLHSKNVGKTISVIKAISEQTNLLALMLLLKQQELERQGVALPWLQKK